ncbi:MAG: YjbQ family protein [Acidobacteria bacterium]|nr:MAG: YjbQ family protein [Acidobacteriota bacterium]
MYAADLVVPTRGIGCYEITAEIAEHVARSGVRDGLAVVFVRHTSASLLIQENADPTVQADLLEFLARIAPEGAGYRHDSEGPDDMPSHLRSAITHTSEVIPVAAGRLALGTWQGVYLLEHRRAARTRRVRLVVIG